MAEQELRQKVVETASEWLGTVEGSAGHARLLEIYNSQDPLPRGTRMRSDWPWCAAFVSAVSVQCGLTDIMPTEMSCPLMIQKYQNIGRWVEDDGYIPSIGDVIFYDWDDSGSGDCTGTADHVGIVTAVYGTALTIIEGNCDDKVMERRISVNARYIRGYGIPDYASKCGAEQNTPKAEQSTSATVDVTAIAYQVINGDWGNGSARQEALTAAGYDYNAVQAEVNRLLSVETETETPTVSEDEITELAYRVINGDFGNGQERVDALGEKYDRVQARVNELLGS